MMKTSDSSRVSYDSKSGNELVHVSKFSIPGPATTEEIAKYVLFVASEDAAVSTAFVFVADGGFVSGPIMRVKFQAKNPLS